MLLLILFGLLISIFEHYVVPVLASGTHPNMMTTGNGGFLVSATFVTNEGCEALVKPTMREIKDARKKVKIDRDDWD